MRQSRGSIRRWQSQRRRSPERMRLSSVVAIYGAVSFRTAEGTP